MRPSFLPLSAAVLAAGCGALRAAGLPPEQHSDARVAVAWNDPNTGGGVVRAFDVEPPWAWETPGLAVGRNPVLHHAGGRLYVVSPDAAAITVIDAVSWRVVDRYLFDPAAPPRDIAVVDPQRAYVTRAAPATELLRLDLVSGGQVAATDFAPLADAFGPPQMNRMVVHGGRLVVQLQRSHTEAINPRGALAVVDLASEALVDADPERAGVQGIELAGTAPRFRMQVGPRRNRLYVSATGNFHDNGGIEEVDLGRLRTNGLILSELGIGLPDFGAFVLTRRARGYFVFSTDIVLSSHLHPFALPHDGDVGPEYLTVLNYFVPAMVYDRAREQLFVPQGGWNLSGVHVFDARDGRQLSRDPRATGGGPTDLLLIPTRLLHASGEAAELEP